MTYLKFAIIATFLFAYGMIFAGAPKEATMILLWLSSLFFVACFISYFGFGYGDR